MIDLHTHTFFSDGILSPAELVYRCKLNGYSAVALTDHADYSNIDSIIESLGRAAMKLGKFYGIDVIAGVELTYIPPEDIGFMVGEARRLGAGIVVVHGETPAENVPPGTNLAAAEAGCDVLAHPGLITGRECSIAAENGVRIELTTRRGHRQTNSHVAETALNNGALLVLDTDSHGPEDLLDIEKIRGVLDECGLEEEYYKTMLKNAGELIEKAKGNR